MDGAGLSRILVAIDGSSQSTEACRLAAELARCYEATLLGLHVATPITPGSSVSPAEYLRAEDAARTQGHRVLEEARSLTRGCAPFAGEVLFGDPTDVIVRRARECCNTVAQRPLIPTRRSPTTRRPPPPPRVSATSRTISRVAPGHS